MCKSSGLIKWGKELSVLSGVGCLISIGATVLTTSATAPITFWMCGSLLTVGSQTLFGCGIWAEPDISKGACIAIPKEEPSKPLNFCFDWTVSLGKTFSKNASDKDACTYGWVASVIGALVVLIIFNNLSKK